MELYVLEIILSEYLLDGSTFVFLLGGGFNRNES